MRQVLSDVPTRWFALQPGDGTLYRFAFGRLESAFSSVYEGPEGVDLSPDEPAVFYEKVQGVGPMFSGVGDGSEYVQVLIRMPHWQGIYEVTESSVLICGKDDGFCRMHAQYLKGHMSDGGYLYTIVAVLLALSVLLEDPYDLEGACKAMLRAPEVLGGD